MELSATVKKMTVIIAVAAVILIIAGVVVIHLRYPNNSAVHFAIGVIMTSALNAFKIVMLERVVNKAIDMGEGKGVKSYVRSHYLFRFVLTGVILFAAVKISPTALWGAVAGVFTLQISVYAMKFFAGKDEKTAPRD